MLKGLVLAYNKDMQEDKEAAFDALDTAGICLELFTSMLSTVKVNKSQLRKAAAGGFINATDCADYLTKKGMPFRDAYRVSGKLVAYCIEHDTDFEHLSLDEYKSFSSLFEDDVYSAVDLDNCMNSRKVYGGPSRESVLHQINIVKKHIEEIKSEIKI